MFDLFRSRQKAMRYLLGAILMIVALSMVVTLIPGYGSTSGNPDDPVIAEIGGQKLTVVQVSRAIQQRLQGSQIPPDMLRSYVPQLVDSMIQGDALTYEFEREGMNATDDEVLSALEAEYSQFMQNGVFMKDQLEAALEQDGQTLQDAIDGARQQVVLVKVQNLAYMTTVVTPAEVDAEMVRKFERAKIKYIAFTPAKFRDQVKITPEEIKAWFDAHRTSYVQPEKRAFQVLVIDQDKVEQSIVVTDAQLHAAYSGSMDNFRMPERVHVRHILFKTTDKSDAEKKQILAKAQDVLKQIKAGADFAEMAKKYSDDSSNAPKGGDLDWIVKGQTVPEFERVAFSLKPNEMSGVITTPYGYHIVQVLAHEPARVKPFDEVKASLTDELKKQDLTDKMQSVADQVHAALEKSPGSAEAIAKQFNVQLVTVPKAGQGEAIPTLGVSPEIDGALSGMKPNDVSQILTLPANRLAVVVLNSRIPAKLSDLSEVESKVRDVLIDNKSQQLAQDKAKEAAALLAKGEDFDKVAKSMKLDVTESTDFGHADSVEGLGGAVYLEDAFTKPVGSIAGPVNILGRMVIYKILDQKKPDISKLTKERAAISDQLKKSKAQRAFSLFMDSVVSRLAAEGKVKIHKDSMKRLEASLQ